MLRSANCLGREMLEDIVGDVVTDEWVLNHGIAIPRATGVHKSSSAWVRVEHGRIVAAGKNDERVLAWLVEQRILNEADVDYAIAYVTCRDAHRAYRKQRGYKSFLDISVAGDSLSCEQAARVFSLLCRGLDRNLRQIVEYACDTVRTPDTPLNYRPQYRKAFTALAREFNAAVSWVRENPNDPKS
jgi:hypothetical protein